MSKPYVKKYPNDSHRGRPRMDKKQCGATKRVMVYIPHDLYLEMTDKARLNEMAISEYIRACINLGIERDNRASKRQPITLQDILNA